MESSSEYSPKVAAWVNKCKARCTRVKTKQEKLEQILAHIGETIDSSIWLNCGLAKPEECIEKGIGYCLEKSLLLCWVLDKVVPSSSNKIINLIQPISGLRHHIAEINLDNERYIIDAEHQTILCYPGTQDPIESLEAIDEWPEILFPIAGRFGPTVLQDSLSALYLGRKPRDYERRAQLALQLVVGEETIGPQLTYDSLTKLLNLHKKRLDFPMGDSAKYSIHTEPFDPYIKRAGITEGHAIAALAWFIETIFGTVCRPILEPIFRGEAYRYVLLVPDPEHGFRKDYWVVDAKSGTLLDYPPQQPISLQNLKAYPVVWASRPELEALWTYTNQGPRNLNFQIGDVCNAKCTMCWQAWRRKNGEHRPTLPGNVVLELVKKYKAGLNSVELVSFGEPLLHPEIQEILEGITQVSQIRQADRHIGINMITNGSLSIPEVLLKEPGNLTFSIDAASKDLYQAIRRGLDFNVVLGNLKQAVKYQERHTGRAIGINFVITKRNYQEILEMAELARDSDVNYLSFLRGAALEKTDDAGQEILPGEELEKEVGALIAQAGEIFSGVKSWFFPRLSERPADSPMSKYPCPLPWTQLAIDTYGHAQPCCRAYDLDLGPAIKAWEGEQLQELRSGLLGHRLDPIKFAKCAACPHKW